MIKQLLGDQQLWAMKRSTFKGVGIGVIRDLFGDHKLINLCINVCKPKIAITYRRDWRHYSSVFLCNELSKVNWSFLIDDVQGFWNDFELKLIDVIDKMVPITKFENNVVNVIVPRVIKNKLSIMKRLLKRCKKKPIPGTQTKNCKSQL